MKHLIMLLLLSGCVSIEPILPTASVAINYAVPGLTDYYLHPDRDYQCEQPQVRAEIGLESQSRYAFGIYGEAMLLCGEGEPGLSEGGLYLRKKWGGF